MRVYWIIFLCFISFSCSKIGHAGWILSMAKNDNGEYFVSSDNYGNRFLWNGSFKRVGSFPYFWGGIYYIQFTCDNKIISATRDNEILISDLSGSNLKEFTAHEDSITGLSVNTNDCIFVSSSKDKYLKIWRNNGSLLKEIIFEKAFPASHNFSHSGNYFCIGLNNGEILIYNNNFYLLKRYKGHEDEVTNVLFLTDNKIVTASRDGFVKIWDIQGQLINSFQAHKKESGVLSLCVNQYGEIVSGSFDRTIKLWDLDGRLKMVFTGHESAVSTLLFNKDGSVIISGSFDKDIRLWNKNTGKCIKRIGLPWYRKNFKI